MRPMIRSFLALALLGLSQLTYAATEAKRPNNPAQGQPPKERPQLSLPAHSNGKAALQKLRESGKLPEFAKFHGLTEAGVIKLFETDSSAYLDTTGALYYVEPVQNIGEITTEPNSGPSVALRPLDQTFQLESKPNSPRTIHLDFNGIVLTGTHWNNKWGLPTINAAPFDLDGNPLTFNEKELTTIQNVWRRVAEDFAAFDVNVTTKDVDESLITRSSKDDTQFGTRVAITRNFTSDSISPCNCGGIATVGVFDSTTDYHKPAWAFHNSLANNEKYMAEAISHEAGHNLGLMHDGTSTVGYYQGHGTGETAWSPIMGIGYHKPLTHWSKGEYLDANNTDDDYLRMQSKSLYFDADDFADSPSQATNANLVSSNGYLNGAWQGVLQGPNDVDVVALDVGAGDVIIDAVPFNNGPNVDLLVKLLDSAGNEIATSNPVEQLSASLTYNNPLASRLYLVVDGTGKGDPLGTGYTDYGSIGMYNISVKAPIAPPAAPKAVATASAVDGEAPLPVTFTGSKSTDVNNDIASYSWSFGDGATASGADVTHTYQAAGTYSAVLTVRDSTGLTGTASVTITVREKPPAEAPQAVASASTTSGEAPLPVAFMGSNSYDANNDIVSYVWNFGDGSSASGANVTHTYRVAGTYNAALTVTDSTGLKGTASVQVTVREPAPTGTTTVDKISMVGVVSGGKGKNATQYSANALVAIVDAAGACVPDATVTITWGGMVSGTAQATTVCSPINVGSGKNKGAERVTGVGAAFNSPKSSGPGTITITVTNVQATGKAFAAGQNDQQSINVF